MILQRAGDDLGGGGGSRVDEHHERDAVEDVGALGAERELRVVHPPLGVDDDPVVQERVGHRHRCVQHAPGVVPEIEDETLEVIVACALSELAHCLAEALAGAELELADPDVSVSRLERAAAHARHVDDGPRDGDLDGAGHSFAHDREDDVGAGLSAHHLHGVGQRHPLHRSVVEPDDQVSRFDAGLLRGGVVDRRDDLDEPVLHADLDPQAPEFAARARLQLLVVVGNEIGGVRVETGQHPADCVLEKRRVLDWLDVVVLDPGENLRERPEIIQRQGSCAVALREDALSDGQGYANRAAEEEIGDRSCE